MNLTGACGLVQDLLHLDLDEFSRLAAQAPVGAEGLLMLLRSSTASGFRRYRTPAPACMA
ncbi:xylulose kinase [Pseudomonas aeruginosa]|nr:xylulose kinase [Pseudomonas aeruginosa]